MWYTDVYVTKDNIRNGHVIGSVNEERVPKWPKKSVRNMFGYVKRKEDACALRRVSGASIPGKKQR